MSCFTALLRLAAQFILFKFFQLYNYSIQYPSIFDNQINIYSWLGCKPWN